MYYSCSCAEFEGTVAPEDTQRCGLVEWADGRLRVLLWADEERRLRKEGVDLLVLDEWEVVWDAASEGWSVVSEDSEFEVI